MKPFLPVLLFFFSIFSFTSRAQCPLDCVNPFFGIDITGVFLSQNGAPCTIELQVINNSLQFSVIQSLVVFTNATCTNCPEVTAGNTGTWTITANSPCSTPGAFYALNPFIAGICNNTTICPLTGVVLPVELAYFEAFSVDSGVALEWKVTTELDNSGFEVQRSTDGRQWEELTFVRGRGTSQEAHIYRHFDTSPTPGTNYYRLKQIDHDGQFEYSDIVSVEVSGDSGGGLYLFPNPTEGKVALRLETGYIGQAELRVYDFGGRPVKAAPYFLDGHALRTDLSLQDLPSGVYLVAVTAGGKQWREKLIIR